MMPMSLSPLPALLLFTCERRQVPRGAEWLAASPAITRVCGRRAIAIRLLRRISFCAAAFSIGIGSATSLHCAAITVREPPIATRPANLAREPNVCSTRMASFHFAIRSERENEPTLI